MASDEAPRSVWDTTLPVPGAPICSGAFAETRLYVLKIRAGVAGQTRHPFDASVTRPSDRLVLMRTVWPSR